MAEKLLVTVVAPNMAKVVYGLPLTILLRIIVIMVHHLVHRLMTMMMMINMTQSATG